jgi:Flp pilus assembly protein TadG
VFAEGLRRLRGDERGAGAIEFALCLPIFLMLVFGVIQFGWTQHTFSTIRYAMQQASRALVIDPNTTQAQLQSLVNARLSKATDATVTVSLAKTTTVNGPIATLQGSYTSTFGIPGLAAFSIPYNVTVTTPLRTGP